MTITRVNKKSNTAYSIITSILCFFLFFTSCNRPTNVLSSTTYYYNVIDTLPQDAATLAYIKPYADSLNKSMNKIIGYAAIDMPKAKPESLMGNFFCDALMQQSNNYFNTNADVCISNYGGLRLPAISKGNINVGKVYELMPFDNFLVAMQVKGSVLQELFNHIAKEGGWPIAGASFIIKENLASEIMIQQHPLDTAKSYTLLLSDYMADGGDKLQMIKGLPYKNSGVFIRDAIITYLIEQQTKGNNIEPKIEGRITNAE